MRLDVGAGKSIFKIKSLGEDFTYLEPELSHHVENIISILWHNPLVGSLRVAACIDFPSHMSVALCGGGWGGGGGLLALGIMRADFYLYKII